jgi:uncharacterized Tic20 family protein
MTQQPGNGPPPAPGPAPCQTPGLVPPVAQGYIVTDVDRTMAMLIHLGLILAAVMSLIIWLMKREKSPFIEHHGKQALGFFIGILIAAAITVPLMFVCVGFVLLPALFVLQIVFPILAALAANRGEWYRYPLVGGLIK